MGLYVLAEQEMDILRDNILDALDVVRWIDTIEVEDAIELLGNSLVILDDLQQHKGILRMENQTNEMPSTAKAEEVEAKVSEAKETEAEAPTEVKAEETKVAVEVPVQA